MAMKPSLFTNEGLAVELARDRRTVAKALRSTPPDGELNGRPAWRLTTALDAMRKRERANRGDGDDVDSLCDELERVAASLDAGLDRVREEPNVGKSRVMLRDIGPTVGTLDQLMERAATGVRPHEARLLGLVRNHVVSAAMSEVLQLGSWTLSDPDLAAARPQADQ